MCQIPSTSTWPVVDAIIHLRITDPRRKLSFLLIGANLKEVHNNNSCKPCKL
jgi:hypothetical protein